MIETLICIILLPFALGAILFTGCLIAGTVKAFGKKGSKKN